MVVGEGVYVLLAVGVTVLVGVIVGVRVGVTYCTAGGRNVTARSRFPGLQADAVNMAEASPVQ